MRWPNRFFPIPWASGLQCRTSFLGWREPGSKSQRKWGPTQTSSSLIPNVRWTSFDFNFSNQFKAQLCVVFIFNIYVIPYNSFSTGHIQKVKEPHMIEVGCILYCYKALYCKWWQYMQLWNNIGQYMTILINFSYKINRFWKIPSIHVWICMFGSQGFWCPRFQNRQPLNSEPQVFQIPHYRSRYWNSQRISPKVQKSFNLVYLKDSEHLNFYQLQLFTVSATWKMLTC